MNTTEVICTSTGNYVTVINGIETFISADGTKNNPVQKPCYQHLSRHNCRPVTVEYEQLSDIPAAFTEILKKDADLREAYINSEAYQQEKEERNVCKRKIQEEWEAKLKDEYETLIASGGVIPATLDNISIILRYFNSMNWGGWHSLPQLSIGYSMNQYDCDGKIATCIILDKKVEGSNKYKVGGRRGHLNKYISLR